MISAENTNILICFSVMIKSKSGSAAFSSLPIPNINFVPEGTAMHDHIIVLTEFIKSYIYLCADTFNFYKVAMMYFVNLTENGFRDKVLLAGFTKEFFGKEEVAEWIEELNATEITHNFTLEPGVWMAPVVPENKTALLCSAAEFILTVCSIFMLPICSRACRRALLLAVRNLSPIFSLWQTAHKQLYCSTVNPSTAFPAPMLQKTN